jgi:integrase
VPRGKKEARFKSFNFTVHTLEAVAPAPAGVARIYYADRKTDGLFLAVSAINERTGKFAKTFTYTRRRKSGPNKGKVFTRALGRFPDLSVDEARAKAAELNHQIAVGEDPGVDPASKDPALGDFFEHFLSVHRPRGEAPTATYLSDNRSMFNRYLGACRARPLSAITRQDVAAWHAALTRQHGPVGANRGLSLLSPVFTTARFEGVFRGDNPCAGIQQNPEHARERYLRDDEFPTFVRAMFKCAHRDLREYLALRLFTGVREANILQMRWEDLNLARAEWVIGKTKNGDPITIYLSPFITEMLAARPGDRTGWVFASPTRRSEHRQDLDRPWQRFRATLGGGFQTLQLKDLRRTFATRALEEGIPMETIANMLGHRGTTITAGVYAKVTEKLARPAVGRTVERMLLEAGGEENQANPSS